MNEFRTLLENFWICKDSDKETYYKVKRDISNFQRFDREQLGWKLVHTENLLKLEKRPAHAESFMGIGEFFGNQGLLYFVRGADVSGGQRGTGAVSVVGVD